MRLFTVGHSNRSADELIALLVAHGIAHLVDVRRQPSSRRWPQFNRPVLAASLSNAGIGYTWIEALGGLRTPLPATPHTALDGAMAGYADHMATAGFAEGVARLASIAAAQTTSVMCAEADPAGCHRALLCDHLVASGWEVRHARTTAPAAPHVLSPGARVRDGAVIYDRGQRSLF